jgi:hypothetical protein
LRREVKRREEGARETEARATDRRRGGGSCHNRRCRKRSRPWRSAGRRGNRGKANEILSITITERFNLSYQFADAGTLIDAVADAQAAAKSTRNEAIFGARKAVENDIYFLVRRIESPTRARSKLARTQRQPPQNVGSTCASDWAGTTRRSLRSRLRDMHLSANSRPRPSTLKLKLARLRIKSGAQAASRLCVSPPAPRLPAPHPPAPCYVDRARRPSAHDAVLTCASPLTTELRS